MKSKPLFLGVASSAALLLVASNADAQLNNQWVTFSKQLSKIATTPTNITNSDTQVVFRTADLDSDTWDDVMCMRKEQASLPGKRASILLMNLNGILTDKTSTLANQSDVGGDQGMMTPQNSREVSIADLNNDGWLDAITAVSISDGDPKHISHPRVYRNLGVDGGGNWLGLKFENSRFPQMKTTANLSVAPRFCGMGTGDINENGTVDVYYVDYDTTETGINEAANWDLNDRLLDNDGNGFFTDVSSTHLTTAQMLSAFGADAEVYDLNADGHLDLIKDTTLNNPTAVRLIYNNPANVGNFTAMGFADIGSGSPYGMDAGNLNNDAIVDIVIVDDGNDKFRLGTGYDGLNRVTWTALKNFTFINGSDDGFGHNPYIRDLDGNGWNDVIITDVDGDLPGCSRRLHIYHNTGSVPGDMNLILKEEVQLASGSQGAGWKGVVGLSSADAKGSYDTGFGDFDKDGDLDMIVSTCNNGAQYFQNETNPVQVVCQTDVGFGGPGDMVFSICGDDLTEAGSVATMELSGAVPNQPLFIPLALSQGPVPFKGGMLVPFPILVIIEGLSTNGSGEFTAPVPGSAGADLHVFMQCIVKNGTVYEFSNGLDCVFGA